MPKRTLFNLFLTLPISFRIVIPIRFESASIITRKNKSNKQTIKEITDKVEDEIRENERHLQKLVHTLLLKYSHIYIVIIHQYFHLVQSLLD